MWEGMNMWVQLIIALLFIASCCIDVEAWQSVSAKEASKQAGKHHQHIDFTVQHSSNELISDGVVYLDSQTNHQHSDNLRLGLSASALAELQLRGIVNPSQTLLGKQLRVTGAVMRINGVTVLPITQADQLSVIA